MKGVCRVLLSWNPWLIDKCNEQLSVIVGCASHTHPSQVMVPNEAGTGAALDYKYRQLLLTGKVHNQ